MERTKITGIGMGSVYTSNYKASFEFYSEVIGLDGTYSEKENGHYFEAGEHAGFYLIGGYEAVNTNEKSERMTFSFNVESALEMFDKLKKAGVKLVQAKPFKMNEDTFWFQCFDPTGNILEFLGGE